LVGCHCTAGSHELLLQERGIDRSNPHACAWCRQGQLNRERARSRTLMSKMTVLESQYHEALNELSGTHSERRLGYADGCGSQSPTSVIYFDPSTPPSARQTVG
jgi:hypothetical protein